MPRSASRLTWQIVKSLVPPEPPPDWHPDLVSAWCEGEWEYTWPLRAHDYLPGPGVVYTFRHPVEAYLSLRSRYMNDVGKFVPGQSGTKTISGEEIMVVDPLNKIVLTKDAAAYQAMVAIGTQWNVWQRLKEDAKNGRDVLFLKYEDYYDDRRQRILDISKFVEVIPSDSHLEDLWNYTSLENNAKRSQDPRFFENEEVTFSHGFMGQSGMQKEHINPETMGRPGAYFKNHTKFVDSVRLGMTPALEALKEMTQDMGYEL
jgi:hypothetical protein